MKKNALIVIILFLILGCGEDKGKIKIWLIDAPPPQDVEHIYLTIMGVGIRNAEGEATTLQNNPYTVDIVGLIGGRAGALTYNYRTGGSFIDVEPGDYTSVLLLLAEINSVVRDSVQDSLLIPEETPVEYELEEDFTIFPGEYLTIVIDFDASKSINWESQPYELTPSFRIFQSSTAGFILGTVKDTSGACVKIAAVQAASSTDTMATLSVDLDTTYSYCLIIPEGTYDISASADGYTISDTIYERVDVIRDSVLTDYNFTLE